MSDGAFLHHEPGYPPMVEGWSTNRYTDELLRHHGRQRHSHEAKGRLLLLPRTGLVVVPFEMTTGAGWNVVVVRSDAAGVYQPDGYSLYVGDREIETAAELDVTRAMRPTTTTAAADRTPHPADVRADPGLRQDRHPVFAAQPVEGETVLGDIRELLDAVIPGMSDPGMEGRPFGSIAVPTPLLVRWRDQLAREDDQDGSSCRACRDVVHSLGREGLCAGCEAQEATYRRQAEGIVTVLEPALQGARLRGQPVMLDPNVVERLIRDARHLGRRPL